MGGGGGGTHDRLCPLRGVLQDRHEEEEEVPAPPPDDEASHHLCTWEKGIIAVYGVDIGLAGSIGNARVYAFMHWPISQY